MATDSLIPLFNRQADLLRRVAELQEDVTRVLEGQKAEPEDKVLLLKEAAEHMGEPVSTFRRRPEYRKAQVSRPGERRLRYSRERLDGIKHDRLAASEIDP